MTKLRSLPGDSGSWSDSTDVVPIELRSDPPLEITVTAPHEAPRPVRKSQPVPVIKRPQLATLLVGAPDQPGIVASLAQLLESHGVKIVHSDQHTDPFAKMFFQRIRFDLSTLKSDRVALEAGVRDVCERYGMEHRLYGDRHRRVAILVSKQDHCL